jgi:hypothetical protein
MNVLDVLAYGTSLGLGSPQQQRDNVFRQSELEQRKMLAQSELETRKAAQAAEAKRWDAQNAPVSEGIVNASSGVLGEAFPGLTGPIPKEVFNQMLQAAITLGKQEPFAQYNPDTGDLLGETRRPTPMLIPGTGSPSQSIAPVAPEDIVMGPTGEPRTMTIPATPQQTARTMPMNRYLTWRDRKRQDVKEARDAAEQERKAGIDTQKDAALTQFSADVSAGMDRIAAFDKNNLARYGLKLADMAKPDFQKEPEDPSIKTGRELRNKLLQERVDALQDAKEAGNIMDKAQRGEEIPPQVREKTVRALERSASINSQISLTMTAEEGEPFKVEAIQNMKNAKFLREYRSRSEQQQLSAPTDKRQRVNEPAETGSLRNRMPAQGSSGIKAKSDATILRLFGPGATFQKLTPAQKQQLADALSAG